MASALNQTPATGADAIWTFIQVNIDPRSYQPPNHAILASVDCGSCAPVSSCTNVCPPGYGGPCGPPSCPPLPCSSDLLWGWGCAPAWCGPPCGCCGGCAKVTQSGSGIGGRYTICGLIQQSAADLMVEGSWLILQLPPYVTSPRPAGGALYHRQFAIQRGTTNALWKIKYSARAGFTGGTPGPAEMPSATDEQIILGGGTDAAPTYGTLLPPDGTYRMQINVYEGDLCPGFYLVTYPLGDPTANAAFMMDALAPGSYPVDSLGLSQEQDPVVIYQNFGANTLKAATLASETSGFRGWLNYTYTSPPAQSFVRLPASVEAVYDSLGALQVEIPRGLNQSILDSSVITGRATYARRAALGGTTAKKGSASGWLWNGIVGLGNGQLIGQTTPRGSINYFWLTLGDVLLRWDGVTSSVTL